MYNTTVASAARDAALAEQYRPDKAGQATVRTKAEREVDEPVSTVYTPVSDVLRARRPLGARGSTIVARHSMDRHSVDGVAAGRGRIGLARTYTPE